MESLICAGSGVVKNENAEVILAKGEGSGEIMNL